MSGVTITKLRQDEQGVWRARVSCEGHTVEVNRRYGSWHGELREAPFSREFVERPVMLSVARELQSRVRRLERGKNV